MTAPQREIRAAGLEPGSVKRRAYEIVVDTWLYGNSYKNSREIVEALAAAGLLAADPDPWAWHGVWHVRHANGSTEDIELEHGNYLEDSTGSAGQFLLTYMGRP